ncbi:MAG: hypothetical protein IKU98_03705 [Bacteroidaceae bacterium]|nr:hypothetical protein [Bacteroidaceae bacterium]
MKKMWVCALAALAIPVATWAQESEENGLYAELNAEMVTNYIWRGQNYGGLSVQPSLTVGWNDLYLNVWGSAGVATDNHREIDLMLGYDLGNFSFGLSDYWYVGADGEDNYFNYAAHTTYHTIEASVGYDFGFMSLAWSTNFGGYDYDEEDKREYSSYIQADVPFTIGDFEGVATVGATPWRSAMYGSDGFTVCEASVALSKEVKITPTFSINTTGKVVVNPATEDAFFVLGIGF